MNAMPMPIPLKESNSFEVTSPNLKLLARIGAAQVNTIGVDKLNSISITKNPDEYQLHIVTAAYSNSED
jgi:hypothetical protein